MKIKLNPDAGVASAIEICQSNTKMKRMVDFGVRNLAELCYPPRPRYWDNALDALSRDIINIFSNIFNNLSLDPDIYALVLKIFYGIGEGLENYNDKELKKKFSDQKGVEVFMQALYNLSLDNDMISLITKSFEFFDRAGVIQEFEIIVPFIQMSLMSNNISLGKMNLVSAVALGYSKYCQKPLDDVALIEAILLYIETIMTNGTAEAMETIHNFMKTIANICKKTTVSLTQVLRTKNILEKFKGNTKITQVASVTLSSMLTQDQLSSSLEILKSSTNYKEKTEALEVLVAMCYVKDFLNIIFESGTIESLINTLRENLQLLKDGNTDEYTVKATIGTIELISHIASKESYAKDIYDTECLSLVISALYFFPENPEGYAASVSALASVLNDRERAMAMISSLDIANTVLSVIYNNPENDIIQSSGVEFISVLAQFDYCKKYLIEESAFEILTYTLQYNKINLNSYKKIFDVLLALAPFVYTIYSISTIGGLQGIILAIDRIIHLEDVSFTVLQVISILSTVTDASTYCSDGSLVDAVLTIISKYSLSSATVVVGTDILENLVTTKDFQRYAKGIAHYASNKSASTEESTKAVINILGLVKVKRVVVISEIDSLINNIIKIFERNIDIDKSSSRSYTFNGIDTGDHYGNHMLCFIQIIKELVYFKLTLLGNLCVSLMTIFKKPETREKKMKSDNFKKMLLYLEDLTDIGGIDDQKTLAEAIKVNLELIKTFKDSRPLTNINLSILNNLISAQQVEGVSLLLKESDVSIIFSTLRNNVYSLDTQMVGLKLISSILRLNPESIEFLKKNDLMNIVQSVSRIHTHDTSLRQIIDPLICKFIGSDKIEDIIVKNIQALRTAIQNQDGKKIEDIIKTINGISVSTDCISLLCRYGLQNDFIKIMTNDTYRKNNSIMTSMVDLMLIMAAKRIGQLALSREDILNGLFSILKETVAGGHHNNVMNIFDIISDILIISRFKLTEDTKANYINIILLLLNEYIESQPWSKNATKTLSILLECYKELPKLASDPVLKSLIDSRLAALENSNKHQVIDISTYFLSQVTQHTKINISNDILKNNHIMCVLNALEAYLDYKNIMMYGCQFLINLSRNNNNTLFPHWYDEFTQKADAVEPVSFLLSHYCHFFEHYINDTEVILWLLESFATFLNNDIGSRLMQSGIMHSLNQIMNLYPDNDTIENLFRKILSFMNIRDLIDIHMSDLITAYETSNTKLFDNSINRLNILCVYPVEKKEEFNPNEETIWKILRESFRIAVQAKDTRSLRCIILFSYRLVEQAKLFPDEKNGAQYYRDYMLEDVIPLLQSTGYVNERIRILSYTMLTFYLLLDTPSTKNHLIATLPMNCFQEIIQYQISNSYILTVSYKVLAKMSEDPAGVEKINDIDNIIELLNNSLKFHKKNDDIVNYITIILNNLIKSRTFTADERMKIMSMFNNFCMILDSDEKNKNLNNLALLNLIDTSLLNPDTNPLILKSGLIDRLLDDIETAFLPGKFAWNSFDEYEAKNMDKRYIMFKVIMSLIQSGHCDQIISKGLHKIILNSLDECGSNPDLFLNGLETICNLYLTPEVLQEAEIRDTIFQRLFGVLPFTDSPSDNHNFETDPHISRFVKFEQDCNEAQKLKFIPIIMKIMNGQASTTSYPSVMKQKVQDYVQHLANDPLVQNNEELKSLFDTLSKMYNDKAGINQEMNVNEQLHLLQNVDNPTALTLKQVYDYLNDCLLNGSNISIFIPENTTLIEYFKFVFQTLHEYGNYSLLFSEFPGYQSQFGFKSWSLWIQHVTDISPIFVEWNIPLLVLSYITTQSKEVETDKDKDIIIATAPSQVIVDLCSQSSEIANSLAEIRNINDVCCNNILQCIETKSTCNDENILPRIQMVSAIAVNRTIFSNPIIVSVFDKVWNLIDEGVFSADVLRELIKAYRLIVCDSHRSTYIKYNVSNRLINEVNTNEYSAILIDVLFIIGALSSDYEFQTIIGDLNGVESVLELLKKHFTDQSGEGVITNSLLVLANLIVGHPENGYRFKKNNGITLNLDVLNMDRFCYDEINAATALITNACFRRDDIKEEYGYDTYGGHLALINALSQYDGDTSVQALRCLENIFKAISNMSLFTPNANKFLENGLVNSLYNLLVFADRLPSNQLRIAIFTLSNLTWEFNPTTTSALGIIVDPVLQIMLKNKNDSPLFTCCCESLTYLCRLEENALILYNCNGVSNIISIVRDFPPNEHMLLYKSLNLLCILLREPNCASVIVSSTTLDYLKDIISIHIDTGETPNNVSLCEMLLSTLKLIREIIIKKGMELVEYWGSIDGMTALVNLMHEICQLEDVHSQLACEHLRCVISLLAISCSDDIKNYPNITDWILSLVIQKRKFSLFRSRRKNNTKTESNSHNDFQPGHTILKFEDELVNSFIDGMFKYTLYDAIIGSANFQIFAMNILIYLTMFFKDATENMLQNYIDPLFNLTEMIYQPNHYFIQLPLLNMYFYVYLGFNNDLLFTKYINNKGLFYNSAVDFGKKSLIRGITKEKKAASKHIRDYFNDFLLSWKDVNKGENPMDGFEKFVQSRSLFFLSEWNTHMYLNGVQDLECKAYLRTGGEFIILIDENNSYPFKWKANQMLSTFQWKIEKSTSTSTGKMADYKDGIPISRIGFILKGFSPESIKKKNKKFRTVSNDCCMTFQGPPTDEFPNGFNFDLMAKNKKERDTFITNVLEWRIANTSV